MSYKVVYPTVSCQKQAVKFLESLAQADQDAIMTAIEAFRKNPRPHGYRQLKPPIKVLSRLADYRLRVGDFRIFYDIDDNLRKVYIHAIRRRNEKTYK